MGGLNPPTPSLWLRHCSRKRSVCPFVRLLPICERYVLKKNEPILMQNGTTDGNVAIDRGGGVAF